MPEDNESPGVTALQQRITELEKTLVQLQNQVTLPESEERYRVLLENMNEGVMYVNIEQVIQFVNGRFCELVGYTRDELIGRNAYELFITQTDRPAMDTRMQRRKQGVTDRYEMQIKRKSGELIWVQISGAPYYDSQNNLIGMLGVHTDITAQKTAETNLRQTEHLFQTIVNSVEEGVIVYDTDLCYQLWNRFMEILTDMPATEVIGKQATELFPHLQEQGIVNLLERALAGETILSNDTPYRIPRTNNTGWVMGMYSPLITPNGDIIGVVGTIRDITGRKQAEDALRQTQKMESLGILAGGIAHDFNNLLVAMLGQTSLALAKLPGNHPAQSHIKKASQAAERAADLTQQMLAYSGRGHFEKQPINLNQLIQENLHLMAIAVPKQVYLRSNLDPSLPLISGDVRQIQQVLMNLILNGAEAIGTANGIVTIVTGTEEITADDDRIWRYDHDSLKPGLYVTLEIYDTGGGINAAVLPQIFDPFFTTKTTGRGLGLAAVQGIVRGHEGGLRVYTEPGKGSTFKILLPANSKLDLIIRDNKALDPAEKRSGLILVIDDEEPVREAVTDILALQGLEVINAANGQEGIDLYQQHEADILLVLLDLSMPGMSGEETFRQLRRLNPHITVILSSGYNEVEATSHFVGKGLAGFIQKPYNMATLTNKVMSYLSTD